MHATILPGEGDLAKWDKLTLNVFKRTCGYPEIKYLIMSQHASMVRVICPKVINSTENGYSDKKGEIGIFAFMKVKKGKNTVFISHYIEWRGKKFDFHKKDQCPVSQDFLNTTIEEFKNVYAIADESRVSY